MSTTVLSIIVWNTYSVGCFQEVVLRLNQALKAKGYTVWLDVEQMQGSTVDAMAEAVEGAAAMMVCVSSSYKESSNCRMCDFRAVMLLHAGGLH
jgi:hypothetical protein